MLVGYLLTFLSSKKFRKWRFNFMLEKVIEKLIGDEDELTGKFGFDVRGLTPFEEQEARKVFGNKLQYDKIRIFEGAGLPNFLDDIGRFLKKMPPREEYIKNAITLGNNCFFGRHIETDNVKNLNTKLTEEQIKEFSWLMHELTHTWQYQNLGWKYLFDALDAQKKLGAKVYDFGGENNLRKQKERGGKLRAFNLEQQGKICQSYYEALVRGKDTGAYDDFIAQI